MAEDLNKNKKKKHFFKDMKTELKKVNWLTPKQLLNNTTAVIVMVVIVAAIVFVLDLAFETLYEQGVEGLKSVVQQDSDNTVDNTVDGATDEETTNTTDDTTATDENQNTETDNTVEANN